MALNDFMKNVSWILCLFFFTTSLRAQTCDVSSFSYDYALDVLDQDATSFLVYNMTDAGRTGIRQRPKSGVWDIDKKTMPFSGAFRVASGNFFVYSQAVNKREALVVFKPGAVSCDVSFFENVEGVFRPATVSFTGDVAFQCLGNQMDVVVGDLNADGKDDLLFLEFIGGADSNGSLRKAVSFLNTSTETTKQFVMKSITDSFEGVRMRSSFLPLVLRDVDKDRKEDLCMVLNKDKASGGVSNVLGCFYSRTTTGNVVFSALDVLTDNVGVRHFSDAYVGRGKSCDVALGGKGASSLVGNDFDSDGDIDWVVGAGNENSLYYLEQKSHHVFAAPKRIALGFGNASVLRSEDIDNDADFDLLILHKPSDCELSNGARVVWLENDGYGNFYGKNKTLFTADHDLNYLVLLRVGGLYSDSGWDMITGDGTDKSYHLMEDHTSDALKNAPLKSIATSFKINTNDSTNSSVVGYRIVQSVHSSPVQNMSYEVSNDGGSHWISVLSAPSNTTNTASPVPFRYFGNDVRWRVVYTQEQNNLSSAHPFHPAADFFSEGFSVSRFQSEYTVAPRSSFARSSLALGLVERTGNSKKYIFASSFMFPGWQGRLTSWDVSSVLSSSVLTRVVSDPDVRMVWDIQGGLPTTVPLYSSLEDNPSEVVLLDTVADTEPKKLGFIESSNARSFLTAFKTGFNTGFRLRDADHAPVVFVGPPKEDEALMPPSYSSFAKEHAHRTAMLYLASNEGVVRALRADTGSLVWEFVPPGVLSVLRSQWQIRGASAEVFQHQTLLDGPMLVQDVFVLGAWRTVLFFGMGTGRGRDSKGFYHALDVTDPSVPKFLWDYSGTDTETQHRRCGVQDPVAVCESSLGAAASLDTCDPNSFVTPNYATNNANTAVLEAEKPSAIIPRGNGSSWTLGTVETTSIASGVCAVSPPSFESCRGELRYHIRIGQDGNYRAYAKVKKQNAQTRSLQVAVDTQVLPSAVTVPSTVYQWVELFNNKTLKEGMMVLGVAVFEDALAGSAVALDKIVITTNTLSSASLDALTPQCAVAGVAVSDGFTNQCVSETVGCDDTLQCCDLPSRDTGYCAPSCNTSDKPSVLGDTVSKPAVMRMRTFRGDRWVALFGSGGGEELGAFKQGTVSVLDAGTGQPLRVFNLSDVSVNEVNPNLFDNEVVGGVALADKDGDGFADRGYVGDVQGRIWKIITVAQDPSAWEACVWFDAGKNDAATFRRQWAPVGMTPAVSVDQNHVVRVFFGTGGWDNAPVNASYHFYAVSDTDPSGYCPPRPRHPSDLNTTLKEWTVAGEVGDRFWADPVVVGNGVVYFSTLVGFGDSVEPCVPDTARSKIYGRAITQLRTFAGVTAAGGSVFGVTRPYVEAEGRVRSPVMVFGQKMSVVARPAGVMPMGESDVYVQNTTSLGGAADAAPVLQRITQPAMINKSVFKWVKWREVEMP
jgi:hypothetical protein